VLPSRLLTEHRYERRADCASCQTSDALLPQVAIRDTPIESATATAHGGCISLEGALQTRHHLDDAFLGDQCANMTHDFERVDATGCAASNLGGALYMTSSALKMLDFRATSSSASSGGAMAVVASTLWIHGGVISGNTALLTGGAVDSTASVLDIQQATISSNTAREGAGIHAIASEVVLSFGSFVDSNVANGAGGGLRATDSDVELHSVIFQQNKASHGGAVSTWKTGVLSTGTTFQDNVYVLVVAACVCVCLCVLCVFVVLQT